MLHEFFVFPGNEQDFHLRQFHAEHGEKCRHSALIGAEDIAHHFNVAARQPRCVTEAARRQPPEGVIVFGFALNRRHQRGAE